MDEQSINEKITILIQKIEEIEKKDDIKKYVDNSITASLTNYKADVSYILSDKIGSIEDKLKDRIEDKNEDIQELKQYYKDIIEKLDKISEISNQNKGALDKYLTNQVILTDSITNLTVLISNNNDRTATLEKQISTHSPNTEEPTLLDRIEKIERIQKDDIIPKITKVESKFFEYEITYSKFNHWYDSTEIFEKLILKPIFKLKLSSNKIKKSFNEFKSRIIEKIGERILYRVVLYLLAGVLSTSVFAELLYILEQTRIGDFIKTIVESLFVNGG